MRVAWGISIRGRFVLFLITFAVLCMPIFGQTNAADWFENGKELYDQGKSEEAIRAFDKAIGLYPKYAWARNDKSWILGKEGKYDEAIKAYDKSTNASNNAIMTNPNNVEARRSLAQTWENKGQALDRQDKYAKANEAFAKAEELKSMG